MKKYFIIAPIFLITLLVILTYLFRSFEISQSIDEYNNIKQIAYELEVQVQKHKFILKEIESKKNFDETVFSAKSLGKTLDYFKEIIDAKEDSKLRHYLNNIQKKNEVLEFLYEDIKSDIAVIQNSKVWLDSNYKNLLQSTDDRALLAYIFDVIHQKHFSEEHEGFEVDLSQVPILQKHVQVILDKRDSLLKLQEQLDENDLIIEFDRVILHIHKKLNVLQDQIQNIIVILLSTSIFLIAFGVFVYIREIIATQKAQKLKNDLQQFVDALNSSAIVSKTDPKGIITYVNNKFCELSEYSKEELIGQPHNIVRHPDMPKAMFENMWKTIQNKKQFHVIIKNKKKTGSFYFVDSYISPILDIDGEVVEYLAVRYDVTELIDSRDRAIVSEKAKNEFLSNMSHELRTPLNAINGFATLLAKKVEDPKHQKYLNTIVDSSNTLVGLINDILDLSKLQSGNFTLDYHDFNLMRKLAPFVENFKIIAQEKEINLDVDVDKHLDIVLCSDWLRLSQIITNLLSNAMKFSGAGKTVFFNVIYKDGTLSIYVEDNGIGMSKEVQNKVFKPFQQADSSTTRVYGGTGLGLSIVLNLVNQMGGEIRLTSEEGKGSKFKVSIPVTQKIDEVQVVHTEQENEIVPLHGHVLIAEDNKANQMLIAALMDEFHLTYKIVNDGVEAVEIFGQENFDIVLMDENMPNLNGTDAMVVIQSRYGKSVPIIALTANAMVGDKEKFLKQGMDGYVAKPIDSQELYVILKRFLHTDTYV